MATPLKIWSKFEVTKDTGTYKFCALEPPLDRLQDVVDLICNYFAKEEACFKASGIPKSEDAMAEYKEFLLKPLTNKEFHTVVCCVDNENGEIGEIIGGSFIALTRKNDPVEIKFKPKTKEMGKLMEMIPALKDMYDICAELNVDTVYDGRGIVVHPKYRGYGIAQELLRTRRLICKEHGVPLTAALMTAYGSQKAAQRDNWETIFEFNFQDFGEKLGVCFEGSPATAKLMMARAS